MKLSSVLRYIEKETGAVASIHILHPAFLDCEALRLEPDQSLHHGEFCRYNKMHGEIKTCINNKARSLNVASRGRSFAGTCPFGIWDYVHPVLFEGKLIAVLYLGGFRKDLPLPSAWKGPLPGIVTEKEKKFRKKELLGEKVKEQENKKVMKYQHQFTHKNQLGKQWKVKIHIKIVQKDLKLENKYKNFEILVFFT